MCVCVCVCVCVFASDPSVKVGIVINERFIDDMTVCTKWMKLEKKRVT